MSTSIQKPGIISVKNEETYINKKDKKDLTNIDYNKITDTTRSNLTHP